MNTQPELSIIVPTCNRAELLMSCLESLHRLRISHEIIVVDGASFDRTREFLSKAVKEFGPDRLRIIREEAREGFVRAANKGFRAARGEKITWINDDARPLPGALESAAAQLDAAEPSVAFVAMFHRFAAMWNTAYETDHEGHTFRLCHIRGTLYANFPMGFRQTFERLNYLDERYFINGADPDLSLKAWYAGMTIEPAWGALIDHDEVSDHRRLVDIERGKRDNALLFEKWNLPLREESRNRFDPLRPCTLRRLRSDLAIAA